MQKLSIVLLFVGSLLLTVFPSFAQGDVELTQTYTSFDRQLTFDYPDGWQVDAGTEEIYIYPVEPVVNEVPDVDIQLFFLTDEMSEQLGISSDDSAEDALTTVMDAMGDDEMEFGDVELLDLGGKVAAAVLAEAEFDNFLAVIIETDSGLFLAQLTGPLDQIEATEDVYYAVLSSLVYAEAEPVDLSSAVPITLDNVSDASIVMMPQLASEDEYAETFASVISSESNIIAVTGYDDTGDFVQIWDLTDGESVSAVYEDAWTMAISPDGNIIGTNSTDTLTVISPEGEVLDGITLTDLNENVNDFRFNSDASLVLASGSNDTETTYTLYDPGTGEAVSEFTTNYSRATAISNDGSMVALVTPPYAESQTLIVVDTATGDVLHTVKESDSISNATFSSDGSHIFYNHRLNDLYYIGLYDLENDEVVYGFEVMMYDSIDYLTFMAGDSIIVGVSYDTIVFFDAEIGRRLNSLETGIDGRANAIGISEDERFIVTSAYGATVVIAVGGE